MNYALTRSNKIHFVTCYKYWSCARGESAASHPLRAARRRVYLALRATASGCYGAHLAASAAASASRCAATTALRSASCAFSFASSPRRTLRNATDGVKKAVEAR